MFDDDFFGTMTQIQAETRRREDELFGDRDEDSLTDAEADIILSDLPHNTKLAKLAVLRGGQTVQPKTFSRRITKAGRIHAAALGIRLD